MTQTIRKAVNWGMGTLWSPSSEVAPPTFTNNTILIAVMGMTGAGKTTLISKITGLDMEIGHGLKSCTKEIQMATIEMEGYEVRLIDTPGFDDTELKDTDVLLMITAYLRSDVRLSGILYLHPIDARRVGGAATRNLAMFRNLVGEENMGNVKLVTTMWDSIEPETGKTKLEELRRDFWGPMAVAGAQVVACKDPMKDGYDIIQSILRTSSVRLRLQKELEEGMRLEETAAGKTLMDQLRDMQEKHAREVEDLRRRITDTAANHETVETILRNEFEEKLCKLEVARVQERKLYEAEIDRLQKKAQEWSCAIL